MIVTFVIDSRKLVSDCRPRDDNLLNQVIGLATEKLRGRSVVSIVNFLVKAI